MKKIIFLASLIFGLEAMACSIAPNYDIPLKNRMMVSVANEYFVDVVSNALVVEDYTKEFAWKYSDSGFQCHDTDILSAKLRITKNHCTIYIEVTQRTEPMEEGGERITTLDINETDTVCAAIQPIRTRPEPREG